MPISFSRHWGWPYENGSAHRLPLDARHDRVRAHALVPAAQPAAGDERVGSGRREPSVAPNGRARIRELERGDGSRGIHAEAARTATALVLGEGVCRVAE